MKRYPSNAPLPTRSVVRRSGRHTHVLLSSMIVLSNMSGSNIEQISFPLCCGEQNGQRRSLSSGAEPYGTMQKSVLWKAVFGTELGMTPSRKFVR